MTVGPTERRIGMFLEFTVFEQGCICLKAMVLEAGGQVIISREDLNADTGTVDIYELPNGDIKVTLLAPDKKP